MMIDDQNDEDDDENEIVESQPKIKWYLIDTERTFCKVWNFFITLLIIYNLVMTPIVLVFKTIYSKCDPNDEIFTDIDENGNMNLKTWECDNLAPESQGDETLRIIEMAIDIIYLIEIVLNFVKRTLANRDLAQIAKNYLTGYFIFDIVSTIPLFYNENFNVYWLKLFRFVHVFRLTQPNQLLLNYLLSKYSKKRQSDLSSFISLIIYVIYSSHINACIWLYLG